jgi:hypothetical protein
MNWDNEDRHMFFTHTKRYPVYSEQLQEIANILTSIIAEDSINVSSVLDVGCGNFRFKGLFPHLEYTGIDLEYGQDIKSDWNKMKGLNPKYDLVFTSLTLMAFPQQEMEKILVQMFAHSDRYVFIYEGIEENNENKFINNYDLFPDMLVASGVSKVKPNWMWRLWRK